MNKQGRKLILWRDMIQPTKPSEGERLKLKETEDPPEGSPDGIKKKYKSAIFLILK